MGKERKTTYRLQQNSCVQCCFDLNDTNESYGALIHSSMASRFVYLNSTSCIYLTTRLISVSSMTFATTGLQIVEFEASCFLSCFVLFCFLFVCFLRFLK